MIKKYKVRYRDNNRQIQYAGEFTEQELRDALRVEEVHNIMYSDWFSFSNVIDYGRWVWLLSCQERKKFNDAMLGVLKD